MEEAEGQCPTGGSYLRQADHLPEGSTKDRLLQEACLTSIPPAKPPSCPHFWFGFCLVRCCLCDDCSPPWLTSQSN